MTSDHLMSAFDVDIDAMRATVQSMGDLVGRQVDRAAKAVRYGDLNLVSRVLEDEDIVNRWQVQADLLCNQILAKRQPLAVDLREVLAAIHTVNDLERIGDEAKKIAIKARDMMQRQSGDELPIARVHEMADLVQSMVAHALDAVARQDAQTADSLAIADRQVDELRDELRTQITQSMVLKPDKVANALDLILVVQSIERIGDHAKNIAEYVVHVVDGIDRRHIASAPAT